LSRRRHDLTEKTIKVLPLADLVKSAFKTPLKAMRRCAFGFGVCATALRAAAIIGSANRASRRVVTQSPRMYEAGRVGRRTRDE